MLALIQGTDSYRIREKVREIAGEYKGKGIIVFLNEESDSQKIGNEILQKSIFNEKKLVVLENLWTIIEQNKNIVSLLEEAKNLKELKVVVKEEKINRKGELFFEKNGEVFSFNSLDKNDLKRWVLKKIESREGKIEKDALSLLAELVENDLWLAANEVDKLLSYKNVITREDVAFFVRPKIEGDIFRAIDSLASGNKKEAFNIFYKHIKKGDSVFYLISMVAFQFRNLILIKQNPGSDSRELEMHPFVFRKSLRQANFFSETDLKRIYKSILKAEADIKTGKADPEAAFDFLIAGI